jgi:hypothetical protein
MASTDSMPVPKKGVAFRLSFTVIDSAGEPVTAFSAPDSEVDKDGAGFTDCTNEATFVGHGMGYIDLTSTEMNADGVSFYFTCTEGHLREAICMAPEEAGDIRTNVTQCGGSTVAAGAIPNVAAGASGGMPTGDANGRVAVQYGTSTGQINLTAGNLAGAVPSVTGNVGGNVTGSVGSVLGSVAGSVASVVGSVGGNVTGSVGSIASGGTSIRCWPP